MGSSSPSLTEADSLFYWFEIIIRGSTVRWKETDEAERRRGESLLLSLLPFLRCLSSSHARADSQLFSESRKLLSVFILNSTGLLAEERRESSSTLCSSSLLSYLQHPGVSSQHILVVLELFPCEPFPLLWFVRSGNRPRRGLVPFGSTTRPLPPRSLRTL